MGGKLAFLGIASRNCSSFVRSRAGFGVPDANSDVNSYELRNSRSGAV